MIGFGLNLGTLFAEVSKDVKLSHQFGWKSSPREATLFGIKKNWDFICADKTTCWSSFAKDLHDSGGKSGFYNVTTLPIWAFLHFVPTDHLGRLINFEQKGDSSGSGTVSESFCKFSYSEPLSNRSLLDVSLTEIVSI